MITMELIPYTENHRDSVEKDLFEKPEIYRQERGGLEITVYYLRKLGSVSMALLESGRLREFIIPNDRVNDAIAHPEAYATEAGLPRSRSNYEE